jgi:RHS repeat-associated protein
MYHPEYCYFKWCDTKTVDTAVGANTSSESFDSDILGNTSYSTAVSNGWIDIGNINALYDEDPYFQFIASSAAQTEMQSQILDYQGSGLSMKEMAALTVRCPSYYNSITGISATCTTFVATGTTSIDDAMWNQYKMFYISAKQKLQRIAADDYAISTSGSNCGKGYNGCIGAESFNPFSSAFNRHLILGSFETNGYQPCYWSTYMLYKDKVRRFNIGEDIPNADKDKADFNVYYGTGLCPSAIDLAQLLHKVASDGNLLSTFSLKTEVTFTKLMYDKIYQETSTASPYLDYDWSPAIDGSDPTILRISFDASGTISSCPMNMTLPSSSYTWAMVTNFGNIKVNAFNPYTNTTGFSIIAYLDDDFNAATPDIEVTVTGNTCLPLSDCKFYDQCRTSDLANKIFNLMSALANNNQFVSTTAIDLESSYPNYLNRYIRNTVLSSGNNNLRWIRTNPSTADFEIYDVSSSGSSENIHIFLSGFSPAFSLSDLYKIKYFKDLKVDDNNVIGGFVGTAVYEVTPGVYSSFTFHATSSIGRMGTCLAPVPVECETKEHQAAIDLSLLFNEWFSNQPITTSTLSDNNIYTELLEYYVGHDDHTNLENISVDQNGFSADVNIYNSLNELQSTCGIKMYHLSSEYTADFSDIVSVEDFWADQTQQSGSKTYHFKMKVKYSDNTYEIIGGYTTCIPIRSCLCEIKDGEGNGVGWGCNTDANWIIDQISRYNNNYFGNNPFLFLLPLISNLEYDCVCDNEYGTYLENYSDTMNRAMTYFEFIVNNCEAYTNACPAYKSYFNTLTEYNTLNPMFPITIDPVSTFNCNCVDKYVDYINSFKLTPKPFIQPPISINDFILNGCEPPTNPSDDCNAIGLSYYTMASNAVNSYNSQTPAPFPPLVMPPYNGTPGYNCNCYLKYAIYLMGNAPYNFPNPAKDFTQFEMEGCEDNDCWEEYYVMLSDLENQAALSGNVPPYNPPAYDPTKCGCYLGYSWYVKSNYGVNMMSIDEWCELNSGMMMMSFGGETLNTTETVSNSKNSNSEKSSKKQTTTEETVVIQGGSMESQLIYLESMESNERQYGYRSICKRDTLISEEVAYVDPCETFKSNQAIYNAKKRYEDQILEKTTEFREAYYSKCLSLTENFTGIMPTRDYHYTLYFYDQAGNLVSTVPPQGVQLIDLNIEGLKIKADREANTKTVYNEHFLKTTYEYNSLNQLKRQSVPDNDKMDVWQVDNSSNIPPSYTVKDIQFVNGNIGYAVANDASSNGYIYKTNDGGVSWNRINPLTADVNKMQMINATDGFAVGDDGLFLVTTDGGINWRIKTIVTSSAVVLNDLNDLYAKSASDVIVVGDGGTVVQCVLSGSWSFTNIAGGVILSTMDVLSISTDVYGAGPTYDKTYLVVNMPASSSNANRIFTSPSYGSTLWTDIAINTKLKAGDLKCVYLIDANNGFAAGVNGVLLKTINGGTNWTHVATSTLVDFNKIFFKNTNEGMALGSNGTLYSTVNGGVTWAQASAIGTYKDFYIHDKTNGVGFAAGNSGLLSYIDFDNISNGKFVKKYITPVALSDDFGAVSSVSATDVFMGSSTGNNLYKANISGDFVYFNNIGSISGSGGFKRAEFSTASNGAFLTNGGKVYNCIYSGSYSFTDISGAGTSYTDLSRDNVNTLYAINSSSNTQIYSKASPWTGALSTFGSSNTTVTNSVVSYTSTKLVAVGNSGAILVMNSGTWNNYSLNTEPLKLNDVYAVPTTGVSSTNTVVAVGNDGTIIKSTDGATTWQTLNGLTYQNLNALMYEDANNGLMVGNNGTVIKSASSVLSVTSTGTSNQLNDVSYNSGLGRYSIVGNSRTFIQTSNLGSTYSSVSIPSASININTVSDVSTTQFVLGQNGFSTKLNSGSWYTCYKTNSELNAVHINKQNGLGMIVGNNGTSIYTNNNGNVWTVNKPTLASATTLYTLTAVAVWNSSNIYVTTNASVPFKYGNLQASAKSNLTGLSSGTWNDVVINESGKGYMAGPSNTHGYFTAGSLSFTTGSNASAPASYTVNSICVGAKEVFFACNDGKLFSKDMETNANTSYTTGVSTHLLEAAMFDDYNGVVVGANGTVLRIWDQNGNVTIDNKTSENNNGSAVTHNLYAVDYNNRNRLVFAGASGHIKNLETEKQFTSIFWYDQLGRVVVSQNTKQYNKATQAHSYTLYDALGRTTEVGEIAQSDNINNLFVDRKLDDALFATWIGSGSRTEVTQTYYDEQFASGGLLAQENLRKRVASTTYEDVYDGNPYTYQSATHFSYDIHGYVNIMAQEINEVDLLSTGLNVKYVEYEYDMLSGKVNQVIYNAGSRDQYYHKYEYDGDNRITHVYTSKDGLWWDNDAKYSYYHHGALARTVIGDLEVQGMDYAYTLHGWIKGVNSNTLQSNRDIGRDGEMGTARQFVAKDAFGYSLGYYDGDYQGINSYSLLNQFEADMSGSDFQAARQNLYNGNIGSMVTAKPQVASYSSTRTIVADVRGGAYKYDQLNRLKEARSFFNLNLVGNIWQNGAPLPNDYYEDFEYDAMGNIAHLNRWGNAGVQMDDLVYNYNTKTSNGNLISNKLYSVDDGMPSGFYTDDIDDQAPFTNAQDATVNTLNNYGYDELGNLIRDDAEEIQNIEWTVYGKIKKVTRTMSSTKPDLEFIYDASGNRLVKIVKPKPLNVATVKKYYYLRDAQGNEMANYEMDKDAAGNVNQLHSNAHPIYGSSRLGVDSRKELLYDHGVDYSAAYTVSTDRYLSLKNYELSNHLGNVLVTVTDKKIAKTNGITLVDYFEPEISTITDYYSFGSPMPTRSWTDPNSKYKYGFNGKEKDDELNVSGGSYDFGARIYDSRLGRWLATDPESNIYVPISPFTYALNNSIYFVDKDGGVIYGTDGKPVTICKDDNNNWVISGQPDEQTREIFESMLLTPTGRRQLTQITTQKREVRLSIVTELIDKKGNIVTYGQAMTENVRVKGSLRRYKKVQLLSMVGENSRFYGLDCPLLFLIVGSHEVGHINPNGGTYVYEDVPTYFELSAIFEYSIISPGTIDVNYMMKKYLSNVEKTQTDINTIKSIYKDVVTSMINSGDITPNQDETKEQAIDRLSTEFNNQLDTLQDELNEEEEKKNKEEDDE